MGGKPDIQSKAVEEKKRKHQKRKMRAVLITQKGREQQFGISIYCNVTLESFFISNGWFLNENVRGEKTVMLPCDMLGFVFRSVRSTALQHAWAVGPLFVPVYVPARFEDTQKSISGREWRRKILH